MSGYSHTSHVVLFSLVKSAIPSLAIFLAFGCSARQQQRQCRGGSSIDDDLFG